MVLDVKPCKALPVLGKNLASVHPKALDGLALWGICLGFFVVLLDATIVNVSLPAIGRSFTLGLPEQQWIINVYTLMFAAFTLNAGVWGDRWGARRVYLGGLVIFVIGTIACGVAPEQMTLLMGRALQGLGSAAVVPCSLALIMQRFTDRRARARALGAWGGISGIGLAAGPVLGGLLVDSVGWRGVFLVAIPVAALSIALVLIAVERSTTAPRAKVDLMGQVIIALALAAITWALTNRAAPSGGGIWTIVVAIFGVVAVLAFIFIERRVQEPMVPLRMFRDSNFSLAVTIGALFNFGLYGALFCLAIYLQEGIHLSAKSSGLVLLPLTAVIAVCATVSGYLTSRFGPRTPMIIGLSAAALGSGLLALSDESTPISAIVAFAGVFGAIGTAMPAMTSVALNSALAGRAGLGSGVLNAARQVGGLVGVALLGSLLESTPGEPSLHIVMSIVAGAYCASVALASQIKRA